MTMPKTAAVVLAAGLGTRMKSTLPKVLHPVAGRSMIGHLMDRLAVFGTARTVVVVGPGMTQVAEAVAPAARDNPRRIHPRRTGRCSRDDPVIACGTARGLGSGIPDKEGGETPPARDWDKQRAE